MQSQTVTIINKLGLHARAAMQFTNTANRFSADSWISYQGRKAHGKSIMEVMVVGATCGVDVEITTEGRDEEAALAAIVELINNRFGEAE
jgi:phosphocarrier protein